MSLHTVSDAGHILAWPTPILMRELEDAETLNEELEKIIIQKAENSYGINASNIGGWHSEHTLLSWGGSAIKTLHNYIDEATIEMCQLMASSVDYIIENELVTKVDGWANICRKGNYHAPHYHPNSVWSGVYYVKANTDKTADKKNGTIAFDDPRPASGMVSLPGQPFGRPLNISPKSGLLLMFPAWLTHSVHPYYEESERISIAFNVRI